MVYEQHEGFDGPALTDELRIKYERQIAESAFGVELIKLQQTERPMILSPVGHKLHGYS